MLLLGADSVDFPRWPLDVRDVRLWIWPWNIVSRELPARGKTAGVRTARRYVCRLKGSNPDELWATVKWSFGYEAVFASAAALIPLHCLAREPGILALTD